MSLKTIDVDLTGKLNVPGPRCTFYPTATDFTEGTSKDLIIANKQTADRDLSLYFHLTICESPCDYCVCTTVITMKQDKSAYYLDYFERELDRMGRFPHPNRKVTQLHLGVDYAEMSERLGLIFKDRCAGRKGHNFEAI